jgi:hypothetical protein
MCNSIVYNACSLHQANEYCCLKIGHDHRYPTACRFVIYPHTCERGFHCDEYEDYGLLGCDVSTLVDSVTYHETQSYPHCSQETGKKKIISSFRGGEES